MKEDKPSNFTMEDIQKVERCSSLYEAINIGLEVLQMASKSTDPKKISYLSSRIRNSRTKLNIVSILCNMLLAGENLSVVDSNYNKMLV